LIGSNKITVDVNTLPLSRFKINKVGMILLKKRIVWFFYELETAGIDLDKIVKINFVDLTKGEHKTEEFKKISPFQSVPAFVTEKGTFYESCSILLSLGSKFQNNLNLVPENKGKYYQWISFACSSSKSSFFSIFS
jgi:glutathione S-transferase